jgi:hypothetical protein
MAADPLSEPKPEAIERVAKAIYMSAVQSARELVAAKILPPERIKSAFEYAFPSK